MKNGQKIILLASVLFFSMLLALYCGSDPEVAQELRGWLAGGSLSEAVRVVLLEVRLPRIIGAAATGVLLAGAGCTVQLLFRNPLSSPHVLGSVNASALGAVLVMALGGRSIYMMLSGSGAGALLSILFLLFIGRGYRQTASLLLAGIALNAFASAAMSGILFAAGERLEGLVFWLLGGFWRLDWSGCAILLLAMMLILPLLWWHRREMNMLYLGERAAAACGVNTRKVIIMAVLSTAAATAVVVANCGVIGFVGLLIPHIARRIFGGEFMNCLIGSALLGACLMILSDLAGRTLLAPSEIPVGVLTSLIGGPFFLMLIMGRLRGNGGGE